MEHAWKFGELQINEETDDHIAQENYEMRSKSF